MKQHLIIPGASRSGTTFLYSLLIQHPQIVAPAKELQFFEKDAEYNKGIAYYQNYFQDTQDEQICMDVSPPYFHKGILIDSKGKHSYDENNDSANRIKKYLPNAKILITLRNPVLRLYSQYYKNRFQGNEQLSLRNALKKEVKGERTPYNSPLVWVYKNQYSVHLTHWFSLFPENNIKIIIFEEWLNNKKVIDDEVMHFLGFPPLQFNRSMNKTYSMKTIKNQFNKGIFKSNIRYKQINKKKYQMIADYLMEDIEKTEKLINRNLTIWKAYEL